MSDRVAEVLVVGAGPAGLVSANLLTAAGVDVLVVEREADVAAEPRAVSVDDESMRLLQSLDLPREPTTALVPGTGTRYFGARGQLLAGAASPVPPLLGHPLKNPIDHAAFTKMLLEPLGDRENATVQFETALVRLEAGPDRAFATLAAGGGAERVEARFVLGCDGGRSAVRTVLGIEMTGDSLDEPWLVIDTVGDPHYERYAMHHGDPDRPHVILPGPNGRCRYEFLLLPGESREEATTLATAQRLLEPHRGDVGPDDILRQQVYVFHSLVAERWRQGPAFLLGDAAHMMPPFAGQGLSTGLRDAANLTWKLTAVLRGRAGEAILDTYEQERRPHAEAMVDLSVRRGRIVMTRSRTRAFVRDAAIWALRRSRRMRRRLDALPLKPQPRHADGLVVRMGDRDPQIVGAMLPQPQVLGVDGRRQMLDDALGRSFALLEVDPDPGPGPTLTSRLWHRIGARRVRLRLGERFPDAPGLGDPPMVADLDGLLSAPLAECSGRVLVVRPDRFVLGAFAPDEEELFVAAWQKLDPDLLNPDLRDAALGGVAATRPTTRSAK